MEHILVIDPGYRNFAAARLEGCAVKQVWCVDLVPMFDRQPTEQELMKATWTWLQQEGLTLMDFDMILIEQQHERYLAVQVGFLCGLFGVDVCRVVHRGRVNNLLAGSYLRDSKYADRKKWAVMATDLLFSKDDLLKDESITPADCANHNICDCLVMAYAYLHHRQKVF